MHLMKSVQMNEKTTEEYWSKYHDSYNQKQEYVVGRQLLDEINGELRQIYDLGDVLELGCGAGYFTETIVENSRCIVATDLSESLLEAAKVRLHDHLNVTFQKQDCLRTAFASESFDFVLMANLIHVIESPHKAIQECHRVLRSTGLIAIVTFTGYRMSLWEKIKMGLRFIKAWGMPPRRMHFFSPDEVESIVEENGFVIKQSKLLGNRTKSLFLLAKKQ